METKTPLTRTSRKGVHIKASKGGRTERRLAALTPAEAADLDKVLTKLGVSFGDWVADHAAEQLKDLEAL